MIFAKSEKLCSAKIFQESGSFMIEFAQKDPESQYNTAEIRLKGHCGLVNWSSSIEKRLDPV